MMKNNLKILSLTAFVLSIPTLIIIDQFYKGYGLLLMFTLITIGLIFDQVMRMQYPGCKMMPLQNYRTNKLLNLFALILFVQAPMALIYVNRFLDKLGFCLMAAMVCFGIVLSHIARLKFPYKPER